MFQGWFFEEIEEEAIGSPISPIVANLYMEYFKIMAIWTVVYMNICGEVQGTS